MGAIDTIYNTLTNSPLPLMIEKLGLSIANAQAALDRNSIDMLQELARYPVKIKDKDYSLLSLGFVPTFYAFTEANIEASMDFSMSEATSFEVGGKVSVETKVVAVSVNANYARKFEQSAQGSSRIAAKLVALPAPEMFMSIVTQNSRNEILLEKIKIRSIGPVNVLYTDTAEITLDTESIMKIELKYTPEDAEHKEISWKVNNSESADIDEDGNLKMKKIGDIVITAESKYNPAIKAEKKIKINSTQ
jgi:hypothetical protein